MWIASCFLLVEDKKKQMIEDARQQIDVSTKRLQSPPSLRQSLKLPIVVFQALIPLLQIGGSDNQKKFENAGTKALIGEELIENEELQLLSESSSNDVPSEAALHTGPHEMEATIDHSP